ncbi:MAG TPA: hypothetical protein VHX42_03305 [Candidatus Babeliales bacterium]|jgi:hypothetical protein|nr:hypothetical protein [Candidatus Babeliales bacterium]
MEDAKTFLRVIIIIMVTCAHIAESKYMSIGDLFAREYSVENNEEDEEEVFERISMLDARKKQKKSDVSQD